MIQTASILYVIIVIGVIGFQFCLIAGAPWGRITQGGRHEGKLPVSGVVAASLSVPLLACMGAGVTSAAGMFPYWPVWVSYIFLAVQALSVFLNWITPSRPERLIWGPVTTVMLGLAVYAVFGSQLT